MTSLGAPEPSPASGRALASGVAATVSGVLPAFLVGGLAVQISHELRLSTSDVGWAFGGFFATAALLSASLGRLGERLGPTRALRLGTAASILLELSIAVAARSRWTLWLLLAASGSLNALLQPAANLMLARAIPPGRQGVAFGLKQAAIPTCTALAGLAVPALALTVGWRWAFVAAALVAAVALALVPRSQPTAVRSRAPLARGLPSTSPTALRWLAVGVAFGAAAASSFGAYLVSSGVDVGLSESQAGLGLTLGGALGIASRISLGYFADHRLTRPLRATSALMAAGIPACALLAWGHPAAHWVGAALAFGFGWAWPGLFNLAVVRAFPSRPAGATGVTQTGTYLGALIGPVLFGAAAERVGYAAGWCTSVCCFAIAAFAVHRAAQELDARAAA